ncbi:MAG: zinc-ribbon domain containing protein [Candidatus Abawacabacteria bacterium]|nr:zinc-ribbon domain containing protein [Candidatus Abawacabacteria bacterium]
MSTICSNCQNTFLISESDQAFYQKIAPFFAGQSYPIPPPTLCPTCRQQRRLATRNDDTLYNRNCSKCHKSIISIYPEVKEYPVYCSACWWSDQWDAGDHYEEYNFSKSFFPQFESLRAKVPRLGLINRNAENSEYTHYTSHNKNCYLIFNADDNQDCYYSHSLDACRDCIDMYWSGRSELCYEGISVGASYNSQFCTHVENMSDCYFCYDCKDCHHCFGCFSLDHKEYHIYNQPYSKEEYEEGIQTIRKQKKSHTGLMALKKEVAQFFLTLPHQYATITNCENCTGNYLVSCNNCINCFNLTRAQDCKYIYDGSNIKDAYDGNFCGLQNSQLMYEVQDCWFGYQMFFSTTCWNCNNMYYCDHCFYSNNCFGCIGLRRKEYCILNKQYTKEEYEKLVPQIIKQMSGGSKNEDTEELRRRQTQRPRQEEALEGRQEWEWGEFFPMSLALFAYHETMAQQYFPQPGNAAQVAISTTDSLPDTIDAIGDGILQSTLHCSQCQKGYRIVPQELAFYRQRELPIPRKCFMCRQSDRVTLCLERKLYERHCHKCNRELLSPYQVDRPETIFCNQCYLDYHH